MEKKANRFKTDAFRSQWFTSFPFPNCSLVPLLHLSVVFEREWKHFYSPAAGRRRGGMVFAVTFRFRTGLSHLPISPSPSSKPVVVRPLICCNLPLQPRCQDRSYFRSSSTVRFQQLWSRISKALRREKRTWEAKKKNMGRKERRLEKDRKRNGKKNTRWQKREVRDCSPICL